ncbi:unnamed protein product, partial [marine sediment metagenome]
SKLWNQITPVYLTGIGDNGLVGEIPASDR